MVRAGTSTPGPKSEKNALTKRLRRRDGRHGYKYETALGAKVAETDCRVQRPVSGLALDRLVGGGTLGKGYSGKKGLVSADGGWGYRRDKVGNSFGDEAISGREVLDRERPSPDGEANGRWNREGYDSLPENAFLAVMDNPLSTFSIDRRPSPNGLRN